MWLDQSRLNSNRYFSNYWIHHNEEEALANIEAGLIDLRLTREGMTEQRWFKMGVAGKAETALSGDQLAGFMKYVPASAHLIQVYAATPADGLSSAIEQSIFGDLPDDDWSPPEIPDRTSGDTDENDNTRAERYSRLDSRFDIDVDDDQAPKRGSTQNITPGKQESNKQVGGAFAKNAGPLLSTMSTSSYCELVRSRSEAGKPFVRFERAIVAQLKPDAQVDRSALERAIVDELRARYVVAGIQPRLEWQDDVGIRFVAQALLEQGAAYAVSGSYLVLASSKEFAAEIVQASRLSTPAAERGAASVEFFALIRVAAARPAFNTLMAKLDGKDQAVLTRVKSDDEEREVKFFSENLSSLIAASAVREVRLTRKSGPLTTEQVVYVW
jgi:hypothetical protein